MLAVTGIWKGRRKHCSRLEFQTLVPRGLATRTKLLSCFTLSSVRGGEGQGSGQGRQLQPALQIWRHGGLGAGRGGVGRGGWRRPSISTFQGHTQASRGQQVIPRDVRAPEVGGGGVCALPSLLPPPLLSSSRTGQNLGISNWEGMSKKGQRKKAG